jgi:hypothetical protein
VVKANCAYILTMSNTVSNDTAAAEVTGAKQRGKPFAPGVSGNPSGRPKGARSRHGEAFLESFTADFQAHGPAVIEQVRLEKPDVYLKIASDLLRSSCSSKPSSRRSTGASPRSRPRC